MASLLAASASNSLNMEAIVNVPPLPLMSDTEDAVLEEDAYKSSELDDPETLDLGSHGLTKLSRAAPGYDLTTLTLLLDNNSLQRLDNIHTYQCLEKVGIWEPPTKIQQTKMLVMLSPFGDFILFELGWQCSANQNQYNEGRLKVMATYLQQQYKLEPTFIHCTISNL